MRLSKFNITSRDTPESGKTAVYNTLTKGMVILEDHVIMSLEKGMDPGMAPSELKSLHDLGVLVPEGFDEGLFFDVYYNQVRFDNSTLRISLLNTLNCNFACPYCYEGELTYGKKQMSGETAEHVVSWIKARALEARAVRINLEYLGGEPLLNMPVIERVGPELLSFCREKGIRFTSFVISNGYLLNAGTARRLAAAGVRNVRVTLDGPEDTHNATRFLRSNGGKTFRTIINNLLECKDIVSISLSGCYTRESAESIPDLLDELIRAGLGPDSVFKVQFSHMSPSETGGRGAAFDKRCIPMDMFHEVVIKAQNELQKRGYGIYTFADPDFSICGAVCSADYTINYDGNIFKCPCLVDHPGYEVGNVREDLRYNAEMVRCLGHTTFDSPDCSNCPVLPVCLGGCRYLSLVKTGKFHSIDCQRTGLEAITRNMVRRMAMGS